jgi:hypothetical protein
MAMGFLAAADPWISFTIDATTPELSFADWDESPLLSGAESAEMKSGEVVTEDTAIHYRPC